MTTPPPSAPRTPAPRWGNRWGALTVGLLSFGWLAVGGVASAADRAATGRAGSPTPSTAAAPPLKLLVIGLDGVSLNLLRPYAEQGWTPNLGRLLRQGASGDLPTIWPMRTPQVWTTAVTGKLPGQHGIWDHQSNTAFVPPELRVEPARDVGSESRRSKALWQLLDARGRRTVTVGWVATAPAERLDHGVIVAPVHRRGDPRSQTIKGSFWRDAQDVVWPPALVPLVKPLIVEPQDITAAELLPFVDLAQNPEARRGLPKLEAYDRALPWSLARSKSAENLTTRLAAEIQAEVAFVYFECTDSLLHRYWIFSQPEEAITTRLASHGLPTDHVRALKERYQRVVSACYRDVDARVGRLVTTLTDESSYVMILSDHGFGHAPVPHRLADEPYSGDHLDDGIVIFTGPGVRRGATVEGMTVKDVTPTLLYVLGLPVGDDMVGRPALGLLDPTFISRHKVQFVPTYEAAPQPLGPYPDGYPPRATPYRRRVDNESMGPLPYVDPPSSRPSPPSSGR